MNQPNTMLISEASLRKKLEISRATIYRWRKNNPGYSLRPCRC